MTFVKVPKLRLLPPAYDRYRYGRRSPRLELPRPLGLPPANDDEGLTGYVNGLRASDLEERWARVLSDLKIGFQFQYDVLIPGRAYENVIDFLVVRHPLVYPIEIYGQYTHESQADRERDRQREAELNELFAKQGWLPLLTIWYWEIATPEQARRRAERIFF